jgi:predicted MFS family arabinose efflux permease
MLGLAAATAAGGLATGLPSLIAARAAAGAFGGPATSVALAIIADVVPPARRGRALGAVMTAFSVASVAGVPAGLEIARHGTWRTPLLAVAGLGIAVTAGVFLLLPPLRRHLDGPGAGSDPAPFRDVVRRPAARLAFAATAAVMMAGFSLIPNIAAYVQQNLGYPRTGMGILYFAGGLVSVATMRGIGAIVDRLGAFRVATAGTALFLPVVLIWFVAPSPGVPVVAVFVAFMLSMSLRNVPYTTMVSRVPAPAERARFMSLNSSLQHLSIAAGAFLSTRLLHDLPDGRIGGMTALGGIAMLLGAVHPVVMRALEARVGAAGPPDPGLPAA